MVLLEALRRAADIESVEMKKPNEITIITTPHAV